MKTPNLQGKSTPASTFITVSRGANLTALVGKGCTIYSKSGHPNLYVVPDGMTHSDAWKAVMAA